MMDEKKWLPEEVVQFFPKPLEPGELPIFLGSGDEQIQIGTAVVEDWTTKGFKKISAFIDVFPGERLTFSRIADWEHVVHYAKARYPRQDT